MASMTNTRMIKPTKFCDLEIHTKSGFRITGKFVVPANTSTSVRPSDALRDDTKGFILINEVTIYGNGKTEQRDAVLVRWDAVEWIDLPPNQWQCAPISQFACVP